MNVTQRNGWYYLRVPGALLYSRNKDLLWPSYMTLMITHSKELQEARRNNETMRVRCID